MKTDAQQSEQSHPRLPRLAGAFLVASGDLRLWQPPWRRELSAFMEEL